MNIAFELLLIVLVVIETLMTLELLKDAVWVNRIFSANESNQKAVRELKNVPIKGQFAPNFCAKLLGSTRMVSHRDLLGTSTMFLFLSPDSLPSTSDGVLHGIVNALWAKVDGTLYIVYKGDEGRSLKLYEDLRLNEPGVEHIEIIVDENDELRLQFGVEYRPCCILLDKHGRVDKYGEHVANSIPVPADLKDKSIVEA
jgi:hypothetical protein